MARAVPAVKVPALPTRKQWQDWVAEQTKVAPTFIPPNQICVEDIDAWKAASSELSAVKAREMMLRKRLFDFFFPSPKEGANNVELADGSLIKGGYKLDRKVDDAKLAVLKAFTVGDLRDYLTKLKVDHSQAPDDLAVTTLLQLRMDELVKYKPELAIPQYRTLTAEQLAVFETALDIKPGAPTLEVVPPKTGA